MMKNILSTLLILSISLSLKAQHHQEHLFFLDTDTSWRKELFIFPINFASDIDYEGVEDARFPVGWEKQDSPNFWSYAFAWNIKHEEQITVSKLEVDLQKYFNGLMRTKESTVTITKKGASGFTGAVKTTDAFFTKKPMTLYVTAEKTDCPEKKKSVILFRFSPKEFGNSVWNKLGEVKLPASIAACEETKVKKIYDLVNACTEYGQFNGSVLVAEKGEVIYKGGFGFANMEWDIPNKANTKHRLASISKQFTAMLIAQLAAENKLKFDAPISTYLPDYPKATGDKITVHHLLTHTSGIPNYTSFPSYRDMMHAPYSPADIVKLFAEAPLDFDPGSEFSYSNSAYVLLGVIVENLSEKTYEEALQDKIFTPLKMMDSGYDKHNTVLKNRATGYEKIATKYETASYINMTVPYAAGAIYSTVEDLYKWDQALYTEQLLPKKYMQLLFEKHTPAWGQYYGYGWSVGNLPVGNTKEQSQTIGHGGGINGFNTLITRFTADESVVLLLNNTGRAPLTDMTTAINGILHNKTYTFPKRSVAFTFLESIEKDGLEPAIVFYNKIKADDEYNLDEREMNISGYQLLQSGKTKAAAAIFKLNVAAFPNSFNVYDSYAEALLILGDTTKSIENYKRSVQLNPDNKHGIEVLEGLGIDVEPLIVKVAVEHLRLLAGEYKAVDQARDWKIVIEEKDGKLYGNDGGYRYSLNPIGADKFVNPDDGANLVFDTKDKKKISFLIFGRVTFLKIK